MPHILSKIKEKIVAKIVANEEKLEQLALLIHCTNGVLAFITAKIICDNVLPNMSPSEIEMIESGLTKNYTIGFIVAIIGTILYYITTRA